MGNSADYSWLASSFPSSYRYPEARELVARWTVGLGKARKPGGIWLPLPRKPTAGLPDSGGRWEHGATTLEPPARKKSLGGGPER
jgi:hypothetical protein